MGTTLIRRLDRNSCVQSARQFAFSDLKIRLQEAPKTRQGKRRLHLANGEELGEHAELRSASLGGGGVRTGGRSAKCTRVSGDEKVVSANGEGRSANAKAVSVNREALSATGERV